MSLNRITPPAILQATNFEYNLPPVDQYPIGEHLSLYALNAGTQPVISFEIFIPKIIFQQQDINVLQTCKRFKLRWRIKKY